MYGPGSVLLGRYEIDAQLGVGGSGLVLRAYDHVRYRPVAIKILRTDVVLAADMEARLMREARVIAQLTSQHVVRILDVGILEHGAPFLVMEMLHGSDLGELVARRRGIAPAIAVDFVLQACDALAEAHALGIVHRDIKPSNLFVIARPDGSALVKVLDFGISKTPTFDGELSLTHAASVLGTPAYMSPEQMRCARTADARSDLWALGTVLYELVEGHLPITAVGFAEMVVMASTQPYEPMVVAPQLAPVIARCLAKTPDARYANVAELAVELAPFTDRPLGLACVARTSRVLGVPQRVNVASGTRSWTVASHGGRARRRIAIASAAFVALAIASLLVTTRLRARVQALRDEPQPAAVGPAAAPTGPAQAASGAPSATASTAAAPATAAPANPNRTAPVAPLVGGGAAQASPPAVSGRAPDQPGTQSPAPRSSTPATRATKPAKPPARRKPGGAGSNAGCDPHAKPEGC
jgi:serine/threonine-protein kinase